MEIRPNSNIDSVARVPGAAGKASRPIDADTEVSAFDGSRALEARLSDVPDVRPEKVGLGKRLAGDPEYPPRETIQKIATLLALADPDGSVE
jgi:hypothetical protein